MMKKIRSKLRARSGESLAEVLVALLIIALSSMLLAAMVQTAGGINISVRERDAAFYEELSDAEAHTGETAQGKVKISGQGLGPGGSISVTVSTYGGDGLTSYQK